MLHVLKESDEGFRRFGEVYFSWVESGAFKGWKRHLKMTLNLAVPIGAVKFVFCDDDGGIREERIGEERYVRLTVPPGIWFGFKGVHNPSSLVVNVADIVHDPDEVERRDIHEFEYKIGDSI